MQNLTYRIASFAFILLLGSAPVSAQTFNPMPMPAELTPGTGRLCFSPPRSNTPRTR